MSITEIDSSSQFSLNILQASFAPIFYLQKNQSQTLIREKLLCKGLSYEKGVYKMLLILIPDLCRALGLQLHPLDGRAQLRLLRI